MVGVLALNSCFGRKLEWGPMSRAHVRLQLARLRGLSRLGDSRGALQSADPAVRAAPRSLLRILSFLHLAQPASGSPPPPANPPLRLAPL